MIRERREQKGWTQRQLAEAIGCTDGYVAHIENELKLPSLDICMAVSNVFQLSGETQQRLLETVEAARQQRSVQRIRTRGGAVRGALRTRGGSNIEPETDDLNAETIARDLITDPALRAAYRHLKTVLANSRLRETALNTLSALARECEAD
jgi:transcriptional regulator with XRE-family HTH domain